MKNWNSLSKSGPAAVVLFAGVLVLATGCVEHRVTYVRPAYPAPVQAPGLPPPPPVVLPPPQVVELPPAPPPAPVVLLRSAADLDMMLAPIALYPDPLLAQLLPAATLPAQVVLADRYLREGGDLNLVAAQPWDDSLKALAMYPATLRMLDDNLAWTTDLGQAFLNQPADVMDSVQRLRAKAVALGNLLSTPQQTVVVNGGIIEIVPAAPQVIYVPVYQPEVVYVQPPPAPGRFYISFGAGLAVGAWLNHDCDWHAHEVIVWHHDHPRPADWWYRPPTRRETPRVVNTTIVNQNFTVWRPAARATVAERGDRGWGEQAVRTPAPARNQGAKPGRAEVRQTPVVAQAQKPVSPKEVRAVPPRKEAPPGSLPLGEPSTVKPPAAKAPVPETAKPSNGQPALAREATPAPRPNQPALAPKDARPAPAPVTLKQPSVVATSPRSSGPPATLRPVANAAVRPPAGALTGIESSRVTREASARGQQSRETITRPTAATRPAPAPAPSPKANSVETKKPQKAH